MPWRLLLLAFALSSLPKTARAAAPALDRGVAAFGAGAFDEAVALLSTVPGAPGARVSEIVEALRYRAAANASLGHPDQAARDTDAALALDPAVRAPAHADPSVVALFDRIRATRNGVPAHVAIALAGTLDGRHGAVVRVTSEGVPDVIPMRVTVRCLSEGIVVANADAAAGGPLEAGVMPIASSAPLDCVATLTTAGGLRVDRRTLHASALALDSRVDAMSVARARRGRAAPWIAACVTGSAAALTIVVVLGAILGGASTTAHLGAPVAETP